MIWTHMCEQQIILHSHPAFCKSLVWWDVRLLSVEKHTDTELVNGLPIMATNKVIWLFVFRM